MTLVSALFTIYIPILADAPRLSSTIKIAPHHARTWTSELKTARPWPLDGGLAGAAAPAGASR